MQHKQIVAGSLAGPLTILIVWGVSFAGIEIPAYIAQAFTSAMTALGFLILPASAYVDTPAPAPAGPVGETFVKSVLYPKS